MSIKSCALLLLSASPARAVAHLTAPIPVRIGLMPVASSGPGAITPPQASVPIPAMPTGLSDAAASSGEAADPVSAGARGALDWSDAPAEIESIRKEWDSSRFSDPRSPASDRFMHLVKTLRWKMPVEDSVAAARRLADRPAISASLVSEGVTGTFLTMKSGYILKVPARNILRSNPRDYMAYGLLDPKVRARINPDPRDQGQGLHTPAALLAASAAQKSRWNEVQIAGTLEDSRIEISAVFFSPRPPGDPRAAVNPSREFLAELAKRLGVPLIELPL
ncbi:MAG: hypothetical protein HY077_10700 [Elusimicrobia bacterium]|nr:hypothetical protein [Elusimicrobiota bacterium]